jgi:hypothetical protein
MAGIEFDLNTTDPEQLAAVFNQLESGETPVIKEPETPDPAPAATDEQTKNDPASKEQQEAKQGQTEPEQVPQGVATKDGKHVIPYSVLKSERDRASRAEQVAAEMQERVKALEAIQSGNQGAKQGESARTDQRQPTVSDLSPEDLEALKEDFPTVYKAVMASMAAADRLQAQLAPVEETVRNAEAEQARSAQETVQDAIDSIPKLAHIQASNKEAFELAKQFDANFRTQSAGADKPLTERFAKITEMVESALGPIDVPGSKPTSQANAEDLKKAAIAKANASAKATKTDVPTSLSEFPVGQHAAQDEREAAEQLTHQQLAEKFSSMSAEQMDAYFQTL